VACGVGSKRKRVPSREREEAAEARRSVVRRRLAYGKELAERVVEVLCTTDASLADELGLLLEVELCWYHQLAAARAARKQGTQPPRQ
jgi:hypothetical protein